MTPRESTSRDEATFAENLKALRKAAGMSQDEFARAMTRRGIRWHQATVYKVENGERQIQLGEADAAAQILGVPLQQMIRAETETAVQVQRLRLRQQKMRDARIRLVDAVEDYELACEQLTSAIDDADGLLTAEESEQLRRQGLLDAIRDFPEIKRMTNPPDEVAADE